VPDGVIYQLLDAAIQAPSGGNRQEWMFVVVRILNSAVKSPRFTKKPPP
jgi:hypothetical protein